MRLVGQIGEQSIPVWWSNLKRIMMVVDDPDDVNSSTEDFRPQVALNVGSLRCRDLSGVGGRPDTSRT
jgi:hypothetical protein